MYLLWWTQAWHAKDSSTEIPLGVVETLTKRQANFADDVMIRWLILTCESVRDHDGVLGCFKKLIGQVIPDIYVLDEVICFVCLKLILTVQNVIIDRSVRQAVRKKMVGTEEDGVSFDSQWDWGWWGECGCARMSDMTDGVLTEWCLVQDLS